MHIDAAPDWLQPSATLAAGSGSGIAAALDVASAVGRRLPLPGSGATVERWATLAALARENVTVARVLEAHSDALAILAEAQATEAADAAATWGVFAAEGGPAPLTATDTGTGVLLSGHKPWCSLGGVLDAALVTAHLDGTRGLFRVDLGHPGVTARPPTGWVSRGLPSVTSVGLDFADVPARPVGGAGWYLTRPGFAWGGMGVAACWYGAAQGVADRLRAGATGDIRLMHLGRAEAALHGAGCVLDDAAQRIDDGAADAQAGAELALRVRAVVADAAETVLREVGHACGPGPLAFDERHAARVADLEIYVRQHHGERDLAELGRSCVERDGGAHR